MVCASLCKLTSNTVLSSFLLAQFEPEKNSAKNGCATRGGSYKDEFDKVKDCCQLASHKSGSFSDLTVDFLVP
jgi:hypothetical protein